MSSLINSSLATTQRRDDLFLSDLCKYREFEFIIKFLF